MLDLAKAQQRAREEDSAAEGTARVERTGSLMQRIESLTPPVSRRKKARKPEPTGTDFQDVCEKFERCIKFMPPLLPFEAIIVQRFDGTGAADVTTHVTSHAVIRRVLHVWFRTPSGHNRFGPGDFPRR